MKDWYTPQSQPFARIWMPAICSRSTTSASLAGVSSRDDLKDTMSNTITSESLCAIMWNGCFTPLWPWSSELTSHSYPRPAKIFTIASTLIPLTSWFSSNLEDSKVSIALVLAFNSDSLFFLLPHCSCRYAKVFGIEWSYETLCRFLPFHKITIIENLQNGKVSFGIMVEQGIYAKSEGQTRLYHKLRNSELLRKTVFSINFGVNFLWRVWFKLLSTICPKCNNLSYAPIIQTVRNKSGSFTYSHFPALQDLTEDWKQIC